MQFKYDLPLESWKKWIIIINNIIIACVFLTPLKTEITNFLIAD